MSSAFKSIKRGLEQALAHQRGEKISVKVHEPRAVDVGEVRRRIGLTQEDFASTFAISPGTLRHWERGDRMPRGPALVLLNIIDREPQAVLKALAVRTAPKKKPSTARVIQRARRSLAEPTKADC